MYSERPTVIGDPAQVIELSEKLKEALDLSQFVAFVNFGGMKLELVLKSMELFATSVLPYFRAA